jgi:hypothetical protein
MTHPNPDIATTLKALDEQVVDGDAGDDLELELLRDLRNILQKEAAAPHPDAIRITLTPETHGSPVTVDLQEGDNLWIEIKDGDAGALPRATSLFMAGNRLYFGFNSDVTHEWTAVTSVSTKNPTD